MGFVLEGLDSWKKKKGGGGLENDSVERNLQICDV